MGNALRHVAPEDKNARTTRSLLRPGSFFIMAACVTAAPPHCFFLHWTISAQLIIQLAHLKRNTPRAWTCSTPFQHAKMSVMLQHLWRLCSILQDRIELFCDVSINKRNELYKSLPCIYIHAHTYIKYLLKSQETHTRQFSTRPAHKLQPSQRLLPKRLFNSH